uniref:DEAD/DEAH box helicase domain-containing protein n=1 Tax=Panagrolaimus superbus TaxID=310955 RepID=A0A914YLR2_9BILA
MALDCASNLLHRIEEQKALKRAASDDSGIGSNSSTQKSGVVIPPKKYLGSPRSIFFNTENNSGIAGLKKSLFDKYKEVRKIENLYPWQAEFLNDPRITKGENALLTAQTGGGKTLIAEVLMLREIFNRNCSAIFVLPLVALVQEKH